jgi:hypothetical protein
MGHEFLLESLTMTDDQSLLAPTLQKLESRHRNGHSQVTSSDARLDASLYHFASQQALDQVHNAFAEAEAPHQLEVAATADEVKSTVAGCLPET